MKGLIFKLAVGGGLMVSAVGCCGSGGLSYNQLVDPCWPERYNYQARHSVLDTFNAQAMNGHILDQTIWNWQFETELKTGLPTEKLSAAGMQHLNYLSRRRPAPDPRVYLQTAQDIPMAPGMTPEKLAEARANLDSKRQASILRYLAAQTSGRNLGFEFQVLVHNPSEVGIAATPIGGNQRPASVGGAIADYYNASRGTIGQAAGVLGSGGGGTGGGGGGTGGSSGTGSGSTGGR